ncbi:MAG: hypothetical protein Q8Q26_08645 [Pseudorhodobacter sp.]|nr:hypothetical protein [Pseudorhodobacter sp.]
MKILLAAALGIMRCSAEASADEANQFQTVFDDNKVETRNLKIELRPSRDDVHFSVLLRKTETGLEREHQFEGEGSTDPSPFQLVRTGYCGTWVILLTVKYPWQHSLPEFVQVLDTFAFRESDFEFIDVAYGPLTDIALAEDAAYEPSDLVMLPPIRVRCLAGRDGKPFEFFEQETK